MVVYSYDANKTRLLPLKVTNDGRDSTSSTVLDGHASCGISTVMAANMEPIDGSALPPTGLPWHSRAMPLARVPTQK